MISAAITAGGEAHPNYDGEVQGRWFPANSALYAGLNTVASMGNFALINSGTEAVVMIGYRSAAVRVPV